MEHEVPHLLPPELAYVEHVPSGVSQYPTNTSNHPESVHLPLPGFAPDEGADKNKGDKRCASCGQSGHERRSYTGCPNYKATSEKHPSNKRANTGHPSSGSDAQKQKDVSEDGVDVALSHLHHAHHVHGGEGEVGVGVLVPSDSNGVDGTTTPSSSSSSSSSSQTSTLISVSKVKVPSEDGHNLVSLGRKSRKCAICWHLHKKRSRCDNKCEGCNVMMHVHCYVREHNVFVYAKRWGFPHKKEQ